MKAILMAGGFGTRLRPLTINTPKPMVPMGNRPMMEHIVQLLKENGFDDLIVMLYYQPEVIIRHFGDGAAFGVKIQYLRPQADLGTAGCIKYAEKWLDNTFLVISGDLLTDFDLKSVVAAHRQTKATASLVLTRVTNPLEYGVVIVDDTNRIQRFLEKPSWGEVFSDTINTGIYLLEPSVLKEIPAERSFDFSKNLFPLLLEQQVPMFGHILKGYWKDVGDLSEYRLAHYDLLDNNVRATINGTSEKMGNGTLISGRGTHIAPKVVFEGRVLLGDGCSIGEQATLSNCVLGNNVTIRAGAELTGCIVWDEATIGEYAELEESVIGSRCLIDDRAQVAEGAIIGDDCLIGKGAHIHSNVKIWPHKSVEDGAVL